MGIKEEKETVWLHLSPKIIERRFIVNMRVEFLPKTALYGANGFTMMLCRPSLVYRSLFKVLSRVA